MGKMVWGMVLLAVAGAAYAWLTATVPGGEQRFEQWMRLAKDRGGINL
jgi:hypothetical protein